MRSGWVLALTLSACGIGGVISERDIEDDGAPGLRSDNDTASDSNGNSDSDSDTDSDTDSDSDVTPADLDLPEHTVGDCDTLGERGLWEDITPPAIREDPHATGALIVLADPYAAGTIYVTSDREGVFRSVDCGHTWSKQSTGANADEVERGSIWSAVMDPADPETLYVLAGYAANGLWKSTNAGVDWQQILPLELGVPMFLARVAIDPNPANAGHLIVSFHENCSNGHTPVCFAETFDGGETWEVVNFPASLSGGPAEGSGPLIINSTTWMYANGPLYYTENSGVDWEEVLDEPNVSVKFFRASADAFYLGSGFGVARSTDGRDWEVIPNSGYLIDGVIGDGENLFGVVGFWTPAPGDLAFTATYDAPTTWTRYPSTGLPTLEAGSNGQAYDYDHNVMYVALQKEGVWRVVTR